MCVCVEELGYDRITPQVWPVVSGKLARAEYNGKPSQHCVNMRSLSQEANHVFFQELPAFIIDTLSPPITQPFDTIVSE